MYPISYFPIFYNKEWNLIPNLFKEFQQFLIFIISFLFFFINKSKWFFLFNITMVYYKIYLQMQRNCASSMFFFLYLFLTAFLLVNLILWKKKIKWYDELSFFIRDFIFKGIQKTFLISIYEKFIKRYKIS